MLEDATSSYKGTIEVAAQRLVVSHVCGNAGLGTKGFDLPKFKLLMNLCMIIPCTCGGEDVEDCQRQGCIGLHYGVLALDTWSSGLEGGPTTGRFNGVLCYHGALWFGVCSYLGSH